MQAFFKIGETRLRVDGAQPFRVVGIDRRRPNDGPWMVVGATGDNAVRHHDEIRASFLAITDAIDVAQHMNAQRAA